MDKKANNTEVRVRMAPSPTGPFHIGSARTALFNYLFAKKYKGKFIVRIENTDKDRSKPEWEDNIQESLNWMGLKYDEGLEQNGPYGPYSQSERTETYRRYLERLLRDKMTYYCFCSLEELEKEREQLVKQGKPLTYSGKCLGLSPEESQQRLADGHPHVIRFKTTEKTVEFDDLLRGKIKYDTNTFGDMVIAKDLETPLYNFACVVDDYEMKISHVIRGEEHIANTPKQILLARALGIEPPRYLHLPLILNQQRAKLSKRDPNIAAKVLDYKEQGYLPEALVNFLAFLGWNPGDNREIFTIEQLINEFSIDKLQKAGAIFNVQKLDWLNGYYIRQMDLMKITQLCLPYLIRSGLIEPIWGRQEVIPLVYENDFTVMGFKIINTQEQVDFQKIAAIVGLYHERLKKLSEISELTEYFFVNTIEYPVDLLKWKDMTAEGLSDTLDELLNALEGIAKDSWTKEELEKIIMPIAEGRGDRGKVLWPLRVSLSGKKASAGPMEIALVLGKEKTLKRLRQAKEKIFKKSEVIG